MWLREHTVETWVPAAAIWRRWTDVTSWVVDDPGTLAAQVDDPLAVGSGGWIKPSWGPKSALKIVRFEPLSHLDYELWLPGAHMQCERELISLPGGARFTHRIRIIGPMASVWGLLVGRNIAAGLPAVMKNIVAASQSS